MNIKEGCPVGEPSTLALSRLRREGIPALCRRPWPFERGQKWPLQTDVGANTFARLQNIFNGVLHEKTWADVLIRATEGASRGQFDDMANGLLQRFSEKRVEVVMRQLIETTLLPAAKAALMSKPDAGGSSILSH
jgi:hypothetical protein